YTKIIYLNNGVASIGALSVFPNPFRSEVQLKGVTASDVNSKNIKIYNAMGSEVNYRVVGGNSIAIDPSLPRGVYILRLKGEVFKLFKE
ncbi:MAG TPA: T9SS type A sorting domain-containing protein, partial [Flavitalea sp.]|nr:T9SS type A sorting domain-containing protein [Flavitalea sp.]